MFLLSSVLSLITCILHTCMPSVLCHIYNVLFLMSYFMLAHVSNCFNFFHKPNVLCSISHSLCLMSYVLWCMTNGFCQYFICIILCVMSYVMLSHVSHGVCFLLSVLYHVFYFIILLSHFMCFIIFKLIMLCSVLKCDIISQLYTSSFPLRIRCFIIIKRYIIPHFHNVQLYSYDGIIKKYYSVVGDFFKQNHYIH